MHSNEALIRKGYEAFAAGDIATLEAIFAPDIVWHEPGQNPISGTYKGWPEVLGLLVAYGERSGGTFSAELTETLANDTHGMSIARVRGSRNGVELDQGDHLLCRISDGLIVEARVLYHDQHAVDAFWS
jgi:uncharacterized protein